MIDDSGPYRANPELREPSLSNVFASHSRTDVEIV